MKEFRCYDCAKLRPWTSYKKRWMDKRYPVCAECFAGQDEALRKYNEGLEALKAGTVKGGDK